MPASLDACKNRLVVVLVKQLTCDTVGGEDSLPLVTLPLAEKKSTSETQEKVGGKKKKGTKQERKKTES